MARFENDRTPATKAEPADMGSTKGYNSGRETTKAAAGQTIIQDFALDRSSVVTPRADERGHEMAGGPNDLSHSLQGVRSSNNGAAAGGRPDKFKTPTNIKY